MSFDVEPSADEFPARKPLVSVSVIPTTEAGLSQAQRARRLTVLTWMHVVLSVVYFTQGALAIYYGNEDQAFENVYFMPAEAIVLRSLAFGPIEFTDPSHELGFRVTSFASRCIGYPIAVTVWEELKMWVMPVSQTASVPLLFAGVFHGAQFWTLIIKNETYQAWLKSGNNPMRWIFSAVIMSWLVIDLQLLSQVANVLTHVSNVMLIGISMFLNLLFELYNPWKADLPPSSVDWRCYLLSWLALLPPFVYMWSYVISLGSMVQWFVWPSLASLTVFTIIQQMIPIVVTKRTCCFRSFYTAEVVYALLSLTLTTSVVWFIVAGGPGRNGISIV